MRQRSIEFFVFDASKQAHDDAQHGIDIAVLGHDYMRDIDLSYDDEAKDGNEVFFAADDHSDAVFRFVVSPGVELGVDFQDVLAFQR